MVALQQEELLTTSVLSMQLYGEVLPPAAGGASGIGHAVCRLFAAEGAKVIAADVNELALRQTEQLAPGQIFQKHKLY